MILFTEFSEITEIIEQIAFCCSRKQCRGCASPDQEQKRGMAEPGRQRGGEEEPGWTGTIKAGKKPAAHCSLICDKHGNRRSSALVENDGLNTQLMNCRYAKGCSLQGVPEATLPDANPGKRGKNRKETPQLQ